MILRKDLEIAVRELEHSQPTYQTCEKLADLYIILDHLGDGGYAEDRPKRQSDFLKATEGKSIGSIMDIMDELMETTQLLNPRLYEVVIERIRKL